MPPRQSPILLRAWARPTALVQEKEIDRACAPGSTCPEDFTWGAYEEEFGLPVAECRRGSRGAFGATQFVQVIPESSAAVVERFGRYSRTLHPGANFMIPFVDAIRNRLLTFKG